VWTYLITTTFLPNKLLTAILLLDILLDDILGVIKTPKRSPLGNSCRIEKATPILDFQGFSYNLASTSPIDFKLVSTNRFKTGNMCKMTLQGVNGYIP
jgi:hypothetical protein